MLDGWGVTQTNIAHSAVDQAHTPNMDAYMRLHPSTELQACGQAVGLPVGQMGNSEVGHLHLGAGRVVDQTLLRINRSIASGDFFNKNALVQFLSQVKEKNQALHLMGLLSTGGVHAHIDHLFALLRACSQHNIPKVYIHAFLDGRDMAPKTGKDLIETLLTHNQAYPNAHLSTLIGRYYAMDRNKNWTRTQIAYDALVNGIGTQATNPISALNQSYESNIYDEFVQPIVLNERRIQAGDAVLFFNFRPDRGRQLSEALTTCSSASNAPASAAMRPLAINLLTLTPYSSTYDRLPVVFENEYITHTLGAVVAQANKQQLRLAETEKYPHVTYFFSGRNQAPFAKETRILCPSPAVATYDLAPEMSAGAITQSLLERLNQGILDDFICLNFANPDMVGHTGNLAAAIQACAAVDRYLGQVVTACQQASYGIVIVADHGNAETMRHADGTPHTAHTTHPVPCVLIDKKPPSALRTGGLANIAPTILGRMQLPIPNEMTAERLDI